MYFYGNIPAGSRLYDEADRDLSRIITGYVVNFMKTGDPNGEGLPEWHPYTKDENFTMVFGDGEIGRGEPEFDPNPNPNAARWQVADNPWV